MCFVITPVRASAAAAPASMAASTSATLPLIFKQVMSGTGSESAFAGLFLSMDSIRTFPALGRRVRGYKCSHASEYLKDSCRFAHSPSLPSAYLLTMAIFRPGHRQICLQRLVDFLKGESVCNQLAHGKPDSLCASQEIKGCRVVSQSIYPGAYSVISLEHRSKCGLIVASPPLIKKPSSHSPPPLRMNL